MKNKTELALADMQTFLDRLERWLDRQPALLTETGCLPDAPQYGRDTREFEAMLSSLSVNIRALQRLPNQNAPAIGMLRHRAARLSRRLTLAMANTETMSIHELAEAAIENIQEFAEKTEHVPQYHSTTEYQPMPLDKVDINFAGGAEALIVLFSLLWASGTHWKRRKARLAAKGSK